MELELKHIATYAPYCIKGKLFDNIDVVTGLNFEHGIIETLNNNNCLLEDFKPILRPLSDLTKKYYPDGTENQNVRFWEFVTRDKEVKGLGYTEMVELIKEHYDVFGLIPNGLAIDINTLKQTT